MFLTALIISATFRSREQHLVIPSDVEPGGTSRGISSRWPAAPARIAPRSFIQRTASGTLGARFLDFAPLRYTSLGMTEAHVLQDEAEGVVPCHGRGSSRVETLPARVHAGFPPPMLRDIRGFFRILLPPVRGTRRLPRAALSPRRLRLAVMFCPCQLHAHQSGLTPLATAYSMHLMGSISPSGILQRRNGAARTVSSAASNWMWVSG